MAAAVDSVGGSAWRILLSFSAFVGLTGFWFYLLPRLGVPGHESVRADDEDQAAGPIHPRFEGLHRAIARLAIAFTVIIFLFCSITYYAALRWGWGYSP